MIDRFSLVLLRELKQKGIARFSTLKSKINNPRTLSSKLSYLMSHGLIEKRSGLYCLTERGIKAETLLEDMDRLLAAQPNIDVERVPHPLFRPVLRRFCEELLESWRENLVGVLLFGSVARGDWNADSDIDILVIARRFQTDRRGATRDLLEVRKRLWETEEYREAVKSGFHPTIEFYVLDAVEAGRFRLLYLDALTEGTVILERDAFLTQLKERFLRRLQEVGAKKIQLPAAGHYWLLGEVKAGEALEL